MSGTQGSSYSSSKAAAAGNKATTQNLQKGLNASGSSKTSSGLGNKPASSSVNAAAAAAARTAAARAATASTQRTQNSSNVGGYGRSSPASASVNAAAARASMMNNQRSAGITQSSPLGKGSLAGPDSNASAKSGLTGGIGQDYSKGTTYSPADYTMAGYGAYKNPNATQRVVNGAGQTIASLAKPGSTFSKGLTLSSGDYMRAGYRDYQQPPSQQSTPQTASASFSPNLSIRDIIGGAYTDNVAGPGGYMMKMGLGPREFSGGEINQAQVQANSEIPMASLGMLASVPKAITSRIKDQSRVPSQDSMVAENYNWNGSPNYAAANAAGMNQAFNVNSMPKVAMEGSIPGGISPDSVPSLPNYASPVSVANREPSPYDAQQQVAGYQNPARAFPSRPAAAPTQTAMNSPMAGQGISFSNNRYSMPAAGYNQEIVRALANQRAVSAGLLGNAGTDTFGKYAPGQVAEAPASSADPNATTDYGIYDQQPTRFQKFKASVEKKGDWVNGLLGGTSQNQPGWTPSGNPNARDPLNNLPPKEREKVVTEAGKAATDPEFKALSDGDKTKVLELIKTGMTLKDALKAIKTGTTGGGTQTASQPLYYPQYYSQWAGLPSGQRYA